ncbi:hypothetical protein JB92DRAFT_2836695 [Gautieria morchelliformis]|nr:hypothetical protein JB92DRAFT_2836695 [Gautieria morchelliformis]
MSHRVNLNPSRPPSVGDLTLPRIQPPQHWDSLCPQALDSGARPTASPPEGANAPSDSPPTAVGFAWPTDARLRQRPGCDCGRPVGDAAAAEAGQNDQGSLVGMVGDAFTRL